MNTCEPVKNRYGHDEYVMHVIQGNVVAGKGVSRVSKDHVIILVSVRFEVVSVWFNRNVSSYDPYHADDRVWLDVIEGSVTTPGRGLS